LTTMASWKTASSFIACAWGGGGKLSSPGPASVAELTHSSIIIAGFS